jgi:hypothetical protein
MVVKSSLAKMLAIFKKDAQFTDEHNAATVTG